MRILIVDDSKAMRMIVRRTLRQAGFDGHELEEAPDG
jgi:two-component system chemotaxis response regulator CheY